MSDPITQTSPDTKRGGGQVKIRKNRPQPSLRITSQEHTEEKNPDPKTRKTSKSRKPPPKVQENGKRKISSAVEGRKSAIHGGASKFIYVTLDPPSKRASQGYLQSPRTSCSSRRSRVARRRKRKLDRPRVVQNSNNIYPIRSCSRADFPEPLQTVVALVPKVSPVGKHGVAVSAKPIGVQYAAIAGCQKSLAVAARKLPLCRANRHPAVQAVGLAVLVRSAGPVAQTFVARKLKVHFPFPGWSG